MSGLLAGANHYRFSSKEWNDNDGLYYYGYRFYDPNLQRWLNRDPIQEWGGLNLYEFVLNAPLEQQDPDGQCPPAAAGTVIGTGAESLGLGGAATLLGPPAAFAGGVAGGLWLDNHTPIGDIGYAIGNWWTPQIGAGGPGRGNPGERGIQREPPKPGKTANRNPQTGPNPKAPAPQNPEPPNPDDPNDQPWWKKPNTPNDSNKASNQPNNTPPPPKDFCPAPASGS